MTRLNIELTLLLSVAIVSCAPTGARTPATMSAGVALRSTTSADVQQFTSVYLDSVAMRSAEASPSIQILGDRGGYSYLLAHRTSSGEVEVHAEWDDVFIVRAGSATLLTGATTEGGRETAPGERRGGHIPKPQRRTLRAGDVAAIPAGFAHQMMPEAGGSVTYLVLKALARAR